LANIAALLSQVQALEIQTRDDIRQAIFSLELANGCIRLILGRTKLNETTRTTLLAQTESIDLLIAAARKEAAHLFQVNDFELGIADVGRQSKGEPRSV
jgi:hypothetical protein